ncbi:MAG: hypothetical protein ACOYOB_01445 [Myxococcota bacterium]
MRHRLPVLPVALALLLFVGCSDETAAGPSDAQSTIDNPPIGTDATTADAVPGTGPYCAPCLSPKDCSPATPECRQDKNGKGYCTKGCSSSAQCASGSSCAQYGTGLGEFACRPDYGACSGGGEHCSPCASQAQCATGNLCITSPDTNERYCAATCGLAGVTCPAGFTCGKVMGAASSVCLRKFEDPYGLIATCQGGDKGYCDHCDEAWECGSRRCATKEGESFCVQPGSCTPQTAAKDCPYASEGATFCVPSDIGMICAPPIAFQCLGFKACLTHICPDGTSCVNGLCKPT